MNNDTEHETRSDNESNGDHVNREDQLAGHRVQGTGRDRTVSFVTLNLHNMQAMAATVRTGMKAESEVEMGICESISHSLGEKVK